MGLSPTIWGPSFWATLHLACLGAPAQLGPEAQNAFRSFVTGLLGVLPCEACRDHAATNLRAVPLEPAIAGGRDTLFRWSVAFHNAVSRMLKKPEMPYEDALAHWTKVTLGQAAPAAAPGATRASGPAPRTLDDKTRNRFYLYMVALLVLGIILGYYLPQWVVPRRAHR